MLDDHSNRFLFTHHSSAFSPRCSKLTLLTLASAFAALSPLQGEIGENSQNGTTQKKKIESPSEAIEPFTGRIIGNRVRMRFQPSLEGPILQEIDAGQLFIVTGSVDEYYAVLPPAGTKAYVFRTYVLDGVVEGQNVNVRLEPDLQSHIVSQLNAGDKISGKICERNSKWLEIDIPESVRFYIAKDYIEKAGDKNYFKQVEMTRKQLQTQLDDLEINIKTELKKPFNQINLAPIASKIRAISSQSIQFPKEKERADHMLKDLQEEYLQLSLSQEGRPLDLPHSPDALHPVVITPAKQEQQSAEKSNDAIDKGSFAADQATSTPLIQQENDLVQEAISTQAAKDEIDFYHGELQRAKTLKGILTRYDRLVKNRPGDFLLVDSVTQVPIAFIYSTTVDLRPFVSKTIEIKATTRPNHNFAFPAYFALQIVEKQSQ